MKFSFLTANAEVSVQSMVKFLKGDHGLDYKGQKRIFKYKKKKSLR